MSKKATPKAAPEPISAPKHAPGASAPIQVSRTKAPSGRAIVNEMLATGEAYSMDEFTRRSGLSDIAVRTIFAGMQFGQLGGVVKIEDAALQAKLAAAEKHLAEIRAQRKGSVQYRLQIDSNLARAFA